MRSKPASPRAAEAALREPLGPWVWLFPTTYLFHIAEELWGGEGFPEWISRFAAVTLTRVEFLRIDIGFWVACLGGLGLQAMASLVLLGIGQEPVLVMPCCAPAILSLRAECSPNGLCDVALLRLRAVCLRFRSRVGLAALATGLSRTAS